jgi:hypothetical protein
MNGKHYKTCKRILHLKKTRRISIEHMEACTHGEIHHNISKNSTSSNECKIEQSPSFLFHTMEHHPTIKGCEYQILMWRAFCEGHESKWNSYATIQRVHG